MNRITDDKTLLRIAKTLFKELKKGDSDNKGDKESRLLVFPPEKVEIHAKGNITFEAEPKEGMSLRECLRLFGVTLYHLATGQSEHNATVDYQPLDSKLWPLISFLLSGQAFNLPRIEKKIKDFSGWSEFKRVFDSKYLPKIKIGTIPLIVVLCLIEEIWLWGFSRPYSSGVALVAFIFIFSIGIAVILCNFKKLPYWIGLLTTILYMGLFAATSFLATYTTSSMYHDTSIKNCSIIVDRTTGEFVARLPLAPGDETLVWPNRIVKLWKHKVVPGIPYQGKIDIEIPLVDGNKKFTLSPIINYRIASPELFAAAWQEWQNKQSLELFIKQTLDERVIPKLNEKFATGIVEITAEIETTDVLFDLALSQEIHQRLKNLLYQGLETEPANLDLAMLELSKM